MFATDRVKVFTKFLMSLDVPRHVSLLLIVLSVMDSVQSLTNLADIPCGRQPMKEMRNPRIITPLGGGATFPGEYPWMISMKYKTGGVHFCGAFLINRQWALTASHCFDNVRDKFITLDMVKVTLGEHNHFEAEEPFDSIDFNVTKVVTHPQYSRPGRFDNDIVLFKLERAVEWSPHVQPICLPENEDKVPGSSYGRGFVAGWGQTGETKDLSAVLRQVSLPILDNAVCQRRFDLFKAKIFVNDFQICAGGLLGGSGDCWGDSGGPLMVRKPLSRSRQVSEPASAVGIVSFGYGCARFGLPGVYTRISYYLPWIKTVLAQN